MSEEKSNKPKRKRVRVKKTKPVKIYSLCLYPGGALSYLPVVQIARVIHSENPYFTG